MKVRNPMFVFHVQDMQRALRFYRDAFELEPTMTTPGWSMLKGPGCVVALHIASRSEHTPRSTAAGLGFEVDDLVAAGKAVETAGGRARPIRPAGLGAPVRVREIEDSEGNVLELRQWLGGAGNLAAS